ncbi:hypothetical protein SteCoe_17239 [Stentor coeruleus]|uniref:Uncharacterized protein n=1 Tax=Stentor coeruleus TaxID=5963 RepID=A0A1R2BZL7_9CILI|nr:hypothetical protein SteCoe_17239 [Stentor coeruleus]
MGCCQSVVTEQQKQIMAKEIKVCIQSNNTSRLKFVCKAFTKGPLKCYNINTFRFKCLKGKYLNMPAYCIYLNKFEVMIFLNEEFKIDFEIVEKILCEYDTSAISEICKNNYLELLKCYLPYYLKFDFEKLSVNSSVTLDFRSRDNSKFNYTVSPIQSACQHGHILILNFVHKYFEDSTPPSALDIHYIDISTGENCAIIACRAGNYPMIRFLHSVCNADFTVINNKNESAIQVLASSAKIKYNADLYNIFVYLVEKTGVNIVHGYEETLLILENSDCINYFESKLAEMQIHTSKIEIEYMNRLIKRNSDEIAHKEVFVDRNTYGSSIEPVTLQFSSLAEIANLLNK